MVVLMMMLASSVASAIQSRQLRHLSAAAASASNPYKWGEQRTESCLRTLPHTHHPLSNQTPLFPRTKKNTRSNFRTSVQQMEDPQLKHGWKEMNKSVHKGQGGTKGVAKEGKRQRRAKMARWKNREREEPKEERGRQGRSG